MKKIVFHFLVFLGLISTSDFTGAYEILVNNVPPEKPQFNEEAFMNLNDHDKSVVTKALEKFDNGSLEEQRQALKQLNSYRNLIKIMASEPTYCDKM